MTQIDWDEYLESDSDIINVAIKDEGEFAIVSLTLDPPNEFYKLHIGLYDGEFLRTDGLQLTKDQLSVDDLEELTSIVGDPV